MRDSVSHTIHVEGDHQPVFDVAAANPSTRDVPPCILTIFGATGDLTRRKLMPALYNLEAPQFAAGKVRYRRLRAQRARFR